MKCVCMLVSVSGDVEVGLRERRGFESPRVQASRKGGKKVRLDVIRRPASARSRLAQELGAFFPGSARIVRDVDRRGGGSDRIGDAPLARTDTRSSPPH
ncbi:hypothetical protein C0J45_13618 [Silurus meridionalis]|nr:hypothetical protein C0J45_13618 [Silurus meridionalis]